MISTPSGIGGAERVLLALVSAGHDKGWDQLVLNPFTRRGSTPVLAGDVQGATYKHHACEHVWELPNVRSWLTRQLSEFQPDLVHVHLFHAEVAVASIPRVSDESRILTHHHGSILEVDGNAIERVLDRASGRRFDRVVAVSEEVERFLIDRYGYDRDKVVRILNGWEGDPVTTSFDSGEPTIVCVANFRVQKDHQTLVEAFRLVREDISNARLILVGDGELLDRTRSLVSDADLSSAVDFTGAVSDVWQYLARADVFALASVYEPLGIVVMEAMAAGLPIVATAVGGIPELVSEGVTGTLVAPRDPEALATALTELLRDQARREELGTAARHAAQDYKMGRMIEGYVTLYDELVGSET